MVCHLLPFAKVGQNSKRNNKENVSGFCFEETSKFKLHAL